MQVCAIECMCSFAHFFFVLSCLVFVCFWGPRNVPFLFDCFYGEFVFLLS